MHRLFQMRRNDSELDSFVDELTSHQDDIFLVIRSMCGDPDVAADIRQAVNMVLWKKRKKFKPGTNFKAWAFALPSWKCGPISE